MFNPRFRSVHDTRDQEKVLYDRETIVWTVLAGVFLRRASRNRMDCDRNEGRFAESVLRLSGQGVDDWRCSRNFYLLMQLANNLWQMFNSCVVPKLGEGCRKMAQFEWVELLFRAFHEIGITVEFASMPRRYVRRMNL